MLAPHSHYGRGMITWEYKIYTPKLRHQFKAEEALNELGAQGWELVMKNDVAFFFMRPISAPS